MSAGNETIADIVAEYRKDLVAMKRGWMYKPTEEYVCILLNRIDEAWKREKSQSWHHREMEELILRHEKEVAELKNQTGNAATMREALAKIWDKQWNILPKNKSEDETLSEIITIIEEALSSPPRNCDVGTAEEQAERLFRQHGDTTVGAEVALSWAQMPYESEAAR